MIRTTNKEKSNQAERKMRKMGNRLEKPVSAEKTVQRSKEVMTIGNVSKTPATGERIVQQGVEARTATVNGEGTEIVIRENTKFGRSIEVAVESAAAGREVNIGKYLPTQAVAAASS